jgi:hypothetical protein
MRGVAGKDEGDDAAKAVGPGAQGFEPDRAVADRLLQGAMAVTADFESGKPHLAAVAEDDGAAVAHCGDGGGSKRRQLAGILRRRRRGEQRYSGGQARRRVVAGATLAPTLASCAALC